MMNNASRLPREYDFVAEDRAEDEPCEKLTPGCCVDHAAADRAMGTESECQTW